MDCHINHRSMYYIQQYPDLDHNPKKLLNDLSRALPYCEEFEFLRNSKSICWFKWNKLYHWYFYGTPNDRDQAPAYPDNNKDRQKMVDKQESILQSTQTRSTSR